MVALAVKIGRFHWSRYSRELSNKPVKNVGAKQREFKSAVNYSNHFEIQNKATDKAENYKK